MRRRLLVVILFLSMVIAGCGSRSGSDPSGAVVLNGCRVDPTRICNSIRGQSVIEAGTGLQADSTRLEQNAQRTANIQVPIKKPNGDELFEVECGMNTLNQSVSWAQVRQGPPITDDDAKFLRARDFCTEPQ